MDRSLDYAHALVDPRAATRLGDGSVDVEVKGSLVSPFTREPIPVLAVPARWLLGEPAGSPASVEREDGTGGVVLKIAGTTLVYSKRGLERLRLG